MLTRYCVNAWHVYYNEPISLLVTKHVVLMNKHHLQQTACLKCRRKVCIIIMSACRHGPMHPHLERGEANTQALYCHGYKGFAFLRRWISKHENVLFTRKNPQRFVPIFSFIVNKPTYLYGLTLCYFVAKKEWQIRFSRLQKSRDRKRLQSWYKHYT